MHQLYSRNHSPGSGQLRMTHGREHLRRRIMWNSEGSTDMSLSNNSFSKVPHIPERTSYDHPTSGQQSRLENLTRKNHTRPRSPTYHRRYALVKKILKIGQGINDPPCYRWPIATSSGSYECQPSKWGLLPRSTRRTKPPIHSSNPIERAHPCTSSTLYEGTT